MAGLLKRIWTAAYPPEPVKAEDALRVGILGAANIGPNSIINPAKSHPQVIIAAVAARDPKKAQAYAKKHSIPIVHNSYQELIDDPSITAIYIPLPNGLHYEWALKSLQKGKHVLLEKPSVSNASQASALFHLPLLSEPNTPVLLEAFHSLFHPAFQLFLSQIEKQNVEFASVESTSPKYIFPNDDIRFLYTLAGGTTMDFGTYTILLLRNIFGDEPEECVSADLKKMPKGYDQNCESAVQAKWRWKNGGTGQMDTDLSRGVRMWGGLLEWIPWVEIPRAVVRHKEVLVPCEEDGKEHSVVRTISMLNFLLPMFWHRIRIVEEHTIRNTSNKKTARKWTEKQTKTAYKWEDGSGKKGEVWWPTYRYQLEEFVNRVKKREGSGIWMDGEDSIKQTQMIDSVYQKAGWPVRPGEV
ncbi:hypothetical protein G7Y89_g3667 [Cudoniella acicularis]|uniref:D-xylose 1-dehydrogenase (NADP(+), D-xylono-1,5-lactone-forming) n=1 Tax=Cudoniella acicularis TaxID=354080 RepID=A0A8H4W7F4_9HELO|nr:hypothetical protein G7Y89_g3667 [Cudoniella acicularis]